MNLAREALAAFSAFGNWQKLGVRRDLRELTNTEAYDRWQSMLPAPATVGINDTFDLTPRESFMRNLRHCVLPNGDYIVAITNDARVELFAIEGGSAHLGGERALWSSQPLLAGTAFACQNPEKWHVPVAAAVLNGTLFVSGGYNSSELFTFNLRNGQVLGQIPLDVVDGVSALAAIGKQRLVVGGCKGDVIVYKHNTGAELTEAYRATSGQKHEAMVSSLCIYGENLAVVRRDGTLSISNLETLEMYTLFGGHDTPVQVMCVDMNDKLVVLGCTAAPYLRVLSVEDGYKPFNTFGAVNWAHSECVRSVELVGSDCVLSSSSHTAAISEILSPRVLFRFRPGAPNIRSLHVLSDASIAVVNRSNAMADERIRVPAEGAELLQAHAGAKRDRATLLNA